MTHPENTLDPPALAVPQSVSRHPWRAFAVRLHFYAGVLVAPLLIVASVTGGLYALAPTVERFVYRDLLFVDDRGPALPLGDQAAAARAAFPGLPLSGIRPAASPGESTRIYLTDPALGEELRRAVFVDPHTGIVLGTEPTWLGYLPFSTWLDGLHRHLNLGEPGRIYSELAASWLWVVALGGLCLWAAKAAGDRRRGRAFRILTVDRSAGGRARTLNGHGATGMWLLAGLLFLSATGITWSTYAGAHVGDLRSAMNWQRPQLDSALADADAHAGHRTVSGGHAAPGPVDYDAVLAAAAGAGVQLPVEIGVPAEAGHAVTVTELDHPYRWTTDAAAVDPGAGTVVATLDYWRDYSLVAKLADWGIRAHMGFLFGMLNQVLLFGVAAGLLTVIARGYRMWWQRRPARGPRWAVGRAPIRGALRSLPPLAVGGIAVAAVAVGWFLPLLGVTLAAFLIIDVIVGSINHRKAESHV
ncbi:PepSY domain-containing protein [Mycobacterium sp. ITM-2016-00317]|uniref:PepSY-associated TM helix domain-containing protein n=1 Tax=Mycobacterium sp. ITM-2016-00317 TaxID=2099694 RepID=UPI00287FB831|nr:PepSY domain-containing protein [Mycobacterium sp. ITM-2016-00317]WNG89456.1 PepSY domain-containing protein [Mycobacterium sp. ITM-2016-00317]